VTGSAQCFTTPAFAQGGETETLKNISTNPRMPPPSISCTMHQTLHTASAKLATHNHHTALQSPNTQPILQDSTPTAPNTQSTIPNHHAKTSILPIQYTPTRYTRHIRRCSHLVAHQPLQGQNNIGNTQTKAEILDSTLHPAKTNIQALKQARSQHPCQAAAKLSNMKNTENHKKHRNAMILFLKAFFLLQKTVFCSFGNQKCHQNAADLKFLKNCEIVKKNKNVNLADQGPKREPWRTVENRGEP